MFENMKHVFDNKDVILASGSPRRIQMLKDDGVNFEIHKPGCEENIHLDLDPRQTVMALALRKALCVAEELGERWTKEGEKPLLILASDTVVVDGGKVIGKPKDEEDAFRILSSLNGRAHQVISGVAILQNIPKFTLAFSETTDVYFKCYREEDIRAYIASGEPMDKAGAYAIQGGFSCYVDHIEGSYNNVVGFPYEQIKEALYAKDKQSDTKYPKLG